MPKTRIQEEEKTRDDIEEAVARHMAVIRATMDKGFGDYTRLLFRANEERKQQLISPSLASPINEMKSGECLAEDDPPYSLAEDDPPSSNSLSPLFHSHSRSLSPLFSSKMSREKCLLGNYPPTDYLSYYCSSHYSFSYYLDDPSAIELSWHKWNFVDLKLFLTRYVIDFMLKPDLLGYDPPTDDFSYYGYPSSHCSSFYYYTTSIPPSNFFYNDSIAKCTSILYDIERINLVGLCVKNALNDILIVYLD
jgi:hypothetical protein